MNKRTITAEDYKRYLTAADGKEIMNGIDELAEKVLEQKQKDLKQLIYTNKEALKILKCSTRSLCKWRSDGIISYSIVGSMLYYTHENLMEFIERHQQKRFK